MYYDRLCVMSIIYYLKRTKKFIYDIGLGKFIGISVLIVFLGAVVFASLHQVNTMQHASKARIVENGTFTEGFTPVNIPLDNSNASCPEATPELQAKVEELVPEEYMSFVNFDSDARKKPASDDTEGFGKGDFRGLNKDDSDGIQTAIENASYVCKSGTIASGWKRYSQDDSVFQWFLSGSGFQVVFTSGKGVGIQQENLSLDVGKTYQISTIAEGDVDGAIVLLRDPSNDKVVEFPLNSINEFVVEQGFIPTNIMIFSSKPNVAFKVTNVSIVDYTDYADDNSTDGDDESDIDDENGEIPPINEDLINTKDCVVGGACGESCVPLGTHPVQKPCDEKTNKIAQCIQDSGAVCGKQDGGSCGWIPSNVYDICEKTVENDDLGVTPNDVSCIVTGCNGEICTEEGNVVSTVCVYKPEFECLKQAKCEQQPNTNRCGWTKTSNYYSCMKDIRVVAK